MSARTWTAGDAVGAWTDLCLLLWLDTAGIHRPRERERDFGHSHDTTIFGTSIYWLQSLWHLYHMPPYKDGWPFTFILAHQFQLPKANLCNFASGLIFFFLIQGCGYFPFFKLLLLLFIFLACYSEEKKISLICYFLWGKKSRHDSLLVRFFSFLSTSTSLSLSLSCKSFM